MLVKVNLSKLNCEVTVFIFYGRSYFQNLNLSGFYLWTCVCRQHILECMHQDTHQESSKSPVTVSRTMWEEEATQYILVGRKIG